MPSEWALEILDKAPFVTVSFARPDGSPYGVPLSLAHTDEKTFYFHCAMEGYKVDALKACDKACFTVIDQPVQEPGNWWYHVRSVVCFGRISFVEDAEEHLSKLRMIDNKYFPESHDMEGDIQKNGPRTVILDLRIEHMTGKRVKEN